MDMERIRTFRQKCQNGNVLGIFAKTTDPAFVETAGYAGCDFAILDMEHGPIGFDSLQNNIRAGEASGLLPIVRVDSLCETSISKALDLGAAGIQIPQISTAEQARFAVRASRFFPMGERGVCRFVRAAEYSSKPRDKYFSEAQNALLIIQLEGKEAIQNLDEILSVQGIDIVFIGPYDLSQSVGVPGQTTHPLVLEAMNAIITKAKAKSIFTGTFTDTPETMDMWVKAGVQYISYSVDVGIFFSACAEVKRMFDSDSKF